MRAKEFVVEQYLIEVSLENLARTPFKGGQTLGQAVAKKVSMSPGVDVSPEDEVGALEMIAAADPTPTNSYTRWLSRMFLAGQFKVPEDTNQIKADMEKYWKLAQSKKLKGPESNVENFKSLDQLYDVIELHADEEGEVQSGKEAKRQEKVEGAEYIIDDPGFKVIWTKTHKANCLYGANTKWCTTGSMEAGETGDDNYFNHYNEQGPLYAVIIGEGEKPRKFLFHYETGQFMDERDQPVENKEENIKLLSSYPGWAKFLNMMIKKHYEPIYNEIKDLL